MSLAGIFNAARTAAGGMGRDFMSAYDTPGPPIVTEPFRSGAEVSRGAVFAKLATSIMGGLRQRGNLRMAQQQQALRDQYIAALTDRLNRMSTAGPAPKTATPRMLVPWSQVPAQLRSLLPAEAQGKDVDPEALARVGAIYSRTTPQAQNPRVPGAGGLPKQPNPLTATAGALSALKTDRANKVGFAKSQYTEWARGALNTLRTTSDPDIRKSLEGSLGIPWDVAMKAAKSSNPDTQKAAQASVDAAIGSLINARVNRATMDWDKAFGPQLAKHQAIYDAAIASGTQNWNVQPDEAVNAPDETQTEDVPDWARGLSDRLNAPTQ